jgi:nucleotide-binding universal stress UspA family protein
MYANAPWPVPAAASPQSSERQAKKAVPASGRVHHRMLMRVNNRRRIHAARSWFRCPRCTTMKILLPVDGSKYTRRMLAYIAAHDELLGGGHDCLLFTVVPRLSNRAAAFFDRQTLQAYYHDEAQAVLRAPLAFAVRHGWSARSGHAAGHAAEEIARAATKDKSGLIVMGTHGHSALGSAMLGSVAQGVLARCRQPVLLVR